MTGRSGRGTARQTIRVDEELWQAFAETCEALGVDRSTAIRDFIRWHIWQPGVKRPDRPNQPRPGAKLPKRPDAPGHD